MTTGTDVRCPHCGAKHFVLLVAGWGVVEVKCWRHTCRQVFRVDLATGKPCVDKVRVILSA